MNRQTGLVDVYDPHVGIIDLNRNITIEYQKEDIRAIHSVISIKLEEFPNLISFVLTPGMEIDDKNYYKVIIRLPYLSEINSDFFLHVQNIVLTSSSFGGIYANDLNRIIFQLRKYRGVIIIDSNVDKTLKSGITNKHLGDIYFGIKNAGGWCSHFPGCATDDEYMDLVKLELKESKKLLIPSYIQFKKSAKSKLKF